MVNGSSEHRVSGAGSSRKLLNTLLCFTEQRPTWTVAELSNQLDLSATSTYRYVALLREVGLLEGAPDSAYRVTDMAIGLAAACEAARPPLMDIALPYITRIRDEIDETVLIARRSGDAVYCVDRVESRRPVRLQFDRGQAMSLHRGSMARVLLAAMTPRERDEHLAKVLPTLDPAAVSLLGHESLDAVHAEGWTESYEEVDDGIWGTAAAITSHGKVVASIGTAAPIFRTDAHRRTRIIPLIRDAGQEISAVLTGA